METVFARTRHNYDSYRDYWKLVKIAGFQSVYIDQIDVTRPVAYIISPLNGEWEPFRSKQRGKEHNALLIWWMLERPSWANGMAAYRRGTVNGLNNWLFDYVFVSDRHLNSLLDDPRIFYVVLGSNKGLGALTGDKKELDFSHLSYINGRRNNMYNRLKKAGLSLGGGGWGEARAKELAISKFVLNVHQDEWAIIEPLRLAVAAAHGTPIFSEKCDDAYPYTRHGVNHGILEVEPEEMVAVAKRVCREPYPPWRAMGLRAHTMLTGEFEFGKMVREAVANLPIPRSVAIV